MHSSFPVDAGILLGAALVIVGVAMGGVADRYRFPGLVLFLALGMAPPKRSPSGPPPITREPDHPPDATPDSHVNGGAFGATHT